MAMQEEGFKYDKPEGVSWPEFLVSQPEPSCGLSLEQEEQRWQPLSLLISSLSSYLSSLIIFIFREAITITETGIWTTSECKDNPPCPLWFYPLTI